LEELVGEGGPSTADVENGRGGVDFERFDKIERDGRNRLVPADSGDPARGIHLVPVLGSAHAAP
jgi:hypothetical protein